MNKDIIWEQFTKSNKKYNKNNNKIIFTELNHKALQTSNYQEKVEKINEICGLKQSQNNFYFFLLILNLKFFNTLEMERCEQ